MTVNEAIKVLKRNRPLIGRIGDGVMEAIDTVLSLINTGNKKGLDDSLQEKSIEVSDSQASLSNKKDRLYTDKDMEAFAEWCADSLYEYIGNRWKSYDLNRIATTSQLRELWEQERRAK